MHDAIWRSLLAGTRFLLNPVKRALIALVLILVAYLLALWGWYVAPPTVLLSQGSGSALLLDHLRQALYSLMPVAIWQGEQVLIRTWQWITPTLFSSAILLYLLPLPLQRLQNTILLSLTRGLSQQFLIVGEGNLADAVIQRSVAERQAVMRGVMMADILKGVPASSQAPYLLMQEGWFARLWRDRRLHSLAFLDDDSEVNHMLCDVSLSAARGELRQHPLHILVRIEGVSLRQAFDDEVLLRAQQHGIMLQSLSLFALQTRTLLRYRGFDRLQHATRDTLRILIAGDAQVADELLLQIAYLAHFRRHRGVHVLLAVPDAAVHIDTFWRQFPSLQAWLNLHVLEIGRSAQETASAVMDQTPYLRSPPDAGIDSIFLLGYTDHGEMQALAQEFERAILRKACQPPPIYRLGTLMYRHGGVRSYTLTATWSVDITELLDTSLATLLDAIPCTIHDTYLQSCLARGEQIGDRPSLQPWTSLPRDFAEDNRALVDHFWIKARDLDICIMPKAHHANSPPVLTAQEIEALAIAEHDRWSAVRLALGWRYASVRNDAERLHHNLVAWDALNEADRNKDRDAVRQFPGVLSQHGYTLQRLRRVTLSADIRPNCGTDKDVLWVIRLEQAKQLDGIEKLLAQGAHVELHITQPLVEFTYGDMARARALLHQSWRVVIDNKASDA